MENKFQLIKLLKNYKSESLAEFNNIMIKSNQKKIGVSIPNLKKISKELVDKNIYNEFLLTNQNIYFEETIVQGFLIQDINCDLELKFKMLDRYVCLIKDWAECDYVCAYLKFIKNNRNEMLQYIKKYLKSNKPFVNRFAIVCLLMYYIDKNYINFILKTLKNIHSNNYYVNMAIAWAFLLCFGKFFNETYQFLKNNKIDKCILQKTISKCNDSLKLSIEQKEIIKKLKY